MISFLKVDDEFKRTLGYLPDDDALDQQTLERMKSTLLGAEIYVQGAIGSSTDFYKREDIEPLYQLACFAIAANLFNHPSNAVSSTTAKAIIGQLRGSFDESEEDNGSTSESGQTKSSD